MAAQLSREELITSEIADFFAGFVEVHTELGGPNTVEEAQAQLTERVLAALAGMNSEPVAQTQFKAVADLYEIDSGSSTPFTKSASDAVKAISNGYKVQEYVKLERLHDAFTAAGGAAVAVPDMVGKLLNILDRHTVELGWGEKPITLADLVIARDGREELDACRAAMQAEPVTAAIGWIKCSDRMPIDIDDVRAYKSVEVLVTDGVFVAVMDCNAGVPLEDRSKFWCQFSQYGDIRPSAITHWMPLPAAPEQEV